MKDGSFCKSFVIPSSALAGRSVSWTQQQDHSGATLNPPLAD
jgi:hypothetical protein